jgi:hypothetical protein
LPTFCADSEFDVLVLNETPGPFRDSMIMDMAVNVVTTRPGWIGE